MALDPPPNPGPRTQVTVAPGVDVGAPLTFCTSRSVMKSMAQKLGEAQLVGRTRPALCRTDAGPGPRSASGHVTCLDQLKRKRTEALMGFWTLTL